MSRTQYIREGIAALEAKLLEFQNFNASSEAELPDLDFRHIERPKRTIPQQHLFDESTFED